MFSGRFDSAFLEDLYSDDLETAIEMFGSSLHHIALELTLIEECFRNGDPEGLRRLFHKIKPLFGYVGLPAFQERLHRFEKVCTEAGHTTYFREEYEAIIATIHEILPLLSQELENMRTYSNSRVS